MLETDQHVQRPQEEEFGPEVPKRKPYSQE